MKTYHISINGQPAFVITEEDLAKQAAEGKYPKGTLIWSEGMNDWDSIEKHFQVPATPPPLPTATKAGSSRTSDKRSIPFAAILWFALFLLDLLCFMFADFDIYGNRAVRMQMLFWIFLFFSFGKSIKALRNPPQKNNESILYNR